MRVCVWCACEFARLLASAELGTTTHLSNSDLHGYMRRLYSPNYLLSSQLLDLLMGKACRIDFLTPFLVYSKQTSTVFRAATCWRRPFLELLQHAHEPSLRFRLQGVRPVLESRSAASGCLWEVPV